MRPALPTDATVPVLGSSINLFFLMAAAASALLNLTAIALVRVWNPSREARLTRLDEQAGDAPAPESISGASTMGAQPNPVPPRRVDSCGSRCTRPVWDNPILWAGEIATWAYGRKVLVIRLVYLALWRPGRDGSWQ